MKKQIFFGSVSVLFLLGAVTNAFASWEGVYELENGFRITRQPQKIKINMGGLNINVEEYSFSRGSSLNNMRATADGMLSILQTREQFEAEMEKLGSRIKEMLVRDASGT